MNALKLFCSITMMLLLASPLHAESVSEADMALLKKRFERPMSVPHPADNPSSEAKHFLGKTLFFDPRLSASRQQSCASCHHPGLYWNIPLNPALEHASYTRKTPGLLNNAWGVLYYWDGKVDSLEAQVREAIVSKHELASDEETVLARLQQISGYRTLFSNAFPASAKPVTIEHVAQAIASFERSIVSGKSPFDAWVKGDSDISDEAKQGFVLFNRKANCVTCHEGWNFTDNSFHDIGIAGGDPGRGMHLPLSSMQSAFKTPSLRNVTKRAPYMHNGVYATLGEVMKHYNGAFVSRGSLSHQIEALKLSETEMQNIIAFLQTLTDERKPVLLPVLP